MSSDNKRQRVSSVNNVNLNLNLNDHPQTPLLNHNNPPSSASASVYSNNEQGLLRFIQTPNWSDVKLTATPAAVSSGSENKEKTTLSSSNDEPPKTDHLKRKAAPQVEEPATRPVTGGPSEKAADDSTAKKDKKIPNPDPFQWLSQDEWMNDPKACEAFIQGLLDCCLEETKRAEAMTDLELHEHRVTSTTKFVCHYLKINRTLFVSKNTVKQQKKDIESYKDKLASADARNRDLETEIALLKTTLISYEKQHSNVNQRAQELQELNTSLKAKDKRLSAKTAIWTSEKAILTSTNESLRKQILQLEGDRRWLICEGFKHVVNKLRASDELLQPVGEVNTRASEVGFQQGLKAGYHFSKAGVPMESISRYDPNAENELVRATREFEEASFPYLEKLAACADAPLELLKAVEPVTSKGLTTSASVSNEQV